MKPEPKRLPPMPPPLELQRGVVGVEVVLLPIAFAVAIVLLLL